MSFFDYLDNLRAKPESTKVRIALSVSFCVTAIIFAFWLMSFNGMYSSEEPVVAKIEVESPVTSLVANVSSAFKGIGEGISNFTAKIGSIFNETYVVPDTATSEVLFIPREASE